MKNNFHYPIWVILFASCCFGTAKHQIIAMEFTILKGSFDRDSIVHLSKVDSLTNHLSTEIVGCIHFDISFNSCFKPGAAGVVDSLSTLEFYTIDLTRSDFIRIDDSSIISFENIYTHGIAVEDSILASEVPYKYCDLAIMDDTSHVLKNYMTHYNTFYDKSETNFQCFEQPVYFKMDIPWRRYGKEQKGILIKATFSSGRVLYSNVVKLPVYMYEQLMPEEG